MQKEVIARMWIPFIFHLKKKTNGLDRSPVTQRTKSETIYKMKQVRK
jgi:hypothetical protein